MSRLDEETPSRAGLPKGLLAAAAALVALIVVLIIAIAPRFFESGGTSAPIGGPFRLVDQEGRTVADTDFRGRLMLIYFGYTFCPDVCPTTLATMAQAYDGLTPDEQKQVALIFITVDPERDTVDQMADYVQNFSPALIGLTGTPEQIANVLQEFRVYARKAEGNGGNYSVDHSSIIYLINRDGKFAAYFSGDTKAADLVAGIKARLAR
jgi:protein SCO1/2